MCLYNHSGLLTDCGYLCLFLIHSDSLFSCIWKVIIDIFGLICTILVTVSSHILTVILYIFFFLWKFLLSFSQTESLSSTGSSLLMSSSEVFFIIVTMFSFYPGVSFLFSEFSSLCLHYPYIPACCLLFSINVFNI